MHEKDTDNYDITIWSAFLDDKPDSYFHDKQMRYFYENFDFVYTLHERFKDVRYEWRPDFLEQFRFPAFDSSHCDDPIDYRSILTALPDDYKAIWIALYHNAKTRQEKLECGFLRGTPCEEVYEYYDPVRYWDGIRNIKNSLRYDCYIGDLKTIIEFPFPDLTDYYTHDSYEIYYTDARKLALQNYPEDMEEKYPWITEYKRKCASNSALSSDCTYDTEVERVAFLQACVI